MRKRLFSRMAIGALALLFGWTVGTDILAQDAPKWVGAFYVKGKVGLKWQPVADAASYAVYRHAAGEEFQKINSLEKTHYFDTKVKPGTIYTYKIVAVMSDGSENASAEKSVTIPGAAAGDFVPPTWVGLRIDLNKIFINWDDVPGAIAYNIYRSETEGGPYEVVGNVTVSKYADKQGLEHGKSYYYVLTALNDEFEETEYSEERHIKFGQSADEIAAAEAEQSKIVLEPIKLTFLFEIKTAGKQGDMNQPADVFVNSKGNIYVTDALNGRVHCFDHSGKHLFSFGEPTNPELKDDPPEGTFQYPFTLFIDKQDNVYVTDVLNHDIQEFTADGRFLKRFRVQTKGSQEPFRPNGLWVLDDGRLIATDAGNHRFIILDRDGNVLLSKGSRGGEQEQFIFPDGVVVTPDSLICIVDVLNFRIQEFDLQGNFKRAFGEPGQTVGTFGRPKCIRTGDNGRLWISDAMANAVQVFDTNGEIKSVINKFEDESIFLATPRGIFIKDGRFYVVNRVPHQVMVFKIG